MLDGNIAMTTGAGVCSVDRCGELGKIHKTRNLFPCRIGSGQCFVPMTFHANAVLDLLGEGEIVAQK